MNTFFEWVRLPGDALFISGILPILYLTWQAVCRPVVPTTLEVVCSRKGEKIRSLVQQGEWFIPNLPGWKQIVDDAPAFELAAVLGDFRVDVPFEHPSAWRLNLVLKRRPL